VIVEIQGLRKIYDGKQRVVAVDGIDLCVHAGELYGLLGPNGAGKTTTISICTTRALPTSGHVRIAGIDVVKSPSMARRCIGVVPQYNTLDRACTVYENIHFHCLYFGFSRAEAKERTERLLEQFHLTERAEAYPSHLSGGMKQRAALARTLAVEPKMLLMDEPFGALDAQTRRHMQGELLGIWAADRRTVVFVTHDIDEAVLLGDRVVVMSGRPGRVLADIPVPFARPRDFRRDAAEARGIIEDVWRLLDPSIAVEP